MFIAQNKKQFRGEENADGIQLWCGNTKTEYPNPPDTGNLSSGVSYLTEIYEQVWAELKMIPEAKKRFNAAEHLIHTTKKNHARFDFDIRFPKMPSYLRRAAIQHALEVYRPMKADGTVGGERENSPGNRILPVKTMPCRSFTGM